VGNVSSDLLAILDLVFVGALCFAAVLPILEPCFAVKTKLERLWGRCRGPAAHALAIGAGIVALYGLGASANSIAYAGLEPWHNNVILHAGTLAARDKLCPSSSLLVGCLPLLDSGNSCKDDDREVPRARVLKALLDPRLTASEQTGPLAACKGVRRETFADELAWRNEKPDTAKVVLDSDLMQRRVLRGVVLCSLLFLVSLVVAPALGVLGWLSRSGREPVVPRSDALPMPERTWRAWGAWLMAWVIRRIVCLVITALVFVAALNGYAAVEMEYHVSVQTGLEVLEKGQQQAHDWQIDIEKAKAHSSADAELAASRCARGPGDAGLPATTIDVPAPFARQP
jgi:hypothetical protein